MLWDIQNSFFKKKGKKHNVKLKILKEKSNNRMS